MHGTPKCRILCGSLLIAAFCGGVHAQLDRSDTIAAHSQSDQFLVYARNFVRPSRQALNLATNASYVQLEPTLVAISGERIKQILLRDLQAPNQWQGKISVTLYPANAATDPINITSTRFRDGWQYRVEMPDVVDRARYVHALVQALLLEMANRTATERSVEIPLWLSQGFTGRLLATSEKEIVLPPPKAGATFKSPPATFINAHSGNPLDAAHLLLSTHPPLSFEELSWPDASQLSGEAAVLYRTSAQVFLTELMGIEDGRACVRATIENLSGFYNWQFAFLRAFQAYFQKPLDVEKWWTLHALHFTGRNLAQNWPPEESWEKLDQVLRSPVEVRATTNDLPLRAEFTLQNIIRDWEGARQTEALSGKLRELEMLRVRVAPAFVVIVDDYHQAISTFLRDREQTGLFIPFRKKAALRRASDEAVQRLDALDARRQTLRPKPASEAGVVNNG